jgi:phosphoesterase RecJ-like protein
MSKSKIMGDILKVLEEAETFLISSHVNPDGDAVGSQIAFYSFLSDLGKVVSVVNSDPVPSVYRFLPNTEVFRIESTSNTDIGSDAYSRWEDAEVAIILDCGELKRVGEELAARIRPRRGLINIDHHLSNGYFGTHNLVDTDACATAELVFHLMEYGGIEMDRDRAMCLYTAILTDTGCFKYNNTTAEAHRISARLIQEGVRPDLVAELVYEVTPYEKARLFGMALGTLRLSLDGKIAYMWVTQEMHRQTGTGSEDTDGFIDYIRSLKDIGVAIFFRETDKGDIKVSLRSKTDLDVSQIAATFGGGGHRAAAGCTISRPLDETVDTVVEAVARRYRSLINSLL